MGSNHSHLPDIIRVLRLNLSKGRYLAKNDVEMLFKLVPNKNITVQNFIRWRDKKETSSFSWSISCCRDRRDEELHIAQLEDYLIYMGVNVSEMNTTVVLDVEAKMKNEDISKKIVRTYVTARVVKCIILCSTENLFPLLQYVCCLCFYSQANVRLTRLYVAKRRNGTTL